MINEQIIQLTPFQNQLYGLSDKGILYVWNSTMYTWDKVERQTFITEESGE